MHPPHIDNPHANPWPEVQGAYLDEFGPIDPKVYTYATSLWPAVEPLVLRTIRDEHHGQRLMIKAVALVSRKLAEQPGRLTNLKSYLSQTFRRLLFEEFEKQTNHAERDAEVFALTTAIPDSPEDEINKLILVHEILDRADSWTREVFHFLILGHTLDEIGSHYHMKGNFVRSRLSKRVKKLADQIRKETRAAERKLPSGHLDES
jgi:DNA-directed RNA polymerase specialized sigma24 family protein